jgi:hypothetical protein
MSDALQYRGILRTAKRYGLKLRFGVYLNEEVGTACAAGIASIALLGIDKMREKREEIRSRRPDIVFADILGKKAERLRAIELGFENLPVLFEYDMNPKLLPYFKIGQRLRKTVYS